jgi:hypothetical protein
MWRKSSSGRCSSAIAVVTASCWGRRSAGSGVDFAEEAPPRNKDQEEEKEGSCCKEDLQDALHLKLTCSGLSKGLPAVEDLETGSGKVEGGSCCCSSRRSSSTQWKACGLDSRGKLSSCCVEWRKKDLEGGKGAL